MTKPKIPECRIGKDQDGCWTIAIADQFGWVTDTGEPLPSDVIASWTPLVPAEPAPVTTFELLDTAAERGYRAATGGSELPAESSFRDLWHKVALGVLDDPQLLPTWACAARNDADNWHRQCNQLDEELQRARQELAEATQINEDWQAYKRRKIEERRKLTTERDAVLARVAELEASIGYWKTRLGEDVAERQARIDAHEELLNAIWLYVKWRYITKQLTTEQKNLWADAVERESERAHPSEGVQVDRWWNAGHDATLGPRHPAGSPEGHFPADPQMPGSEAECTPPDPSGRITDGGPVQPFTDTDRETDHG